MPAFDRWSELVLGYAHPGSQIPLRRQEDHAFRFERSLYPRNGLFRHALRLLDPNQGPLADARVPCKVLVRDVERDPCRAQKLVGSLHSSVLAGPLHRLNHAMSEAKELLARNRAAFDAVTEALDRSGYLSAAEVQELIDQGAAIRVTELSPRSEERSPALDN